LPLLSAEFLENSAYMKIQFHLLSSISPQHAYPSAIENAGSIVQLIVVDHSQRTGYE